MRTASCVQSLGPLPCGANGGSSRRVSMKDGRSTRRSALVICPSKEPTIKKGLKDITSPLATASLPERGGTTEDA